MSVRILVLGASGFTGKLICRNLESNNIDFSAAGWDEKKINSLYPNHENVIIDVQDKSQLDKNIKNYDVLVNAVGPFNLFGYNVVRSAAQYGRIYLDISGEQHFVKYCFDKINKLAEETKALIVNSCSFESLIADLLANEICRKETDYENISTFYHFLNSRPSVGTKLSMKLARYFPAYQLREGKLKSAAPRSHQQEVEINGLTGLKHASFVPFPEVLFFHKEYRPMNAASYYLFENRQSAPMTFDRKVSKISLQTTIERFRRGKNIEPTEEERKNQKFSVAVVTKNRNGEKNQILLKGTDMYNVTAKLIARCVKILIDEKAKDYGVKTPVQVFANKGLPNILSEIGKLQS
jgi:short subunit dehydrogenase-like uncharacterized protein